MGRMNLLKANWYGKVGETVGAKWKDKSTIRTYAIPSDPKTAAQEKVRQIRAVIAGALVMLVASAYANDYKLKILYSGEALLQVELRQGDLRMRKKVKVNIFESNMMGAFFDENNFFLLGFVERKDIENYVLLAYFGDSIDENGEIDKMWDARVVMSIPKNVFEKIEFTKSESYIKWFNKVTFKEFMQAHRGE